MERIGILGGTFDPPHIGHLWLAELALQQLALDQVLLMPAGQPPHKNGSISPLKNRLAMSYLAADTHDDFTVDETDCHRPGPHYSVTLLPLLQEKYPQATFWFLIGSDSLRDLPTWHQPERLLGQCRLAVLPRPRVTVDWVTLALAVPGVDGVVDWLPGPTVDLSSTAIRRWLRDGRLLRYLLPPPIINYINTHQLYREERDG